MRLPKLLIVLGSLVAPSVVSAQVPRDIDSHRFTPAFDAQGFIGVPGTSTPGSMRPTFGLFLDYAYEPFMQVYSSGGIPEPLYAPSVEHRITASVSAQLGLGTRAAIGVLVPAALYQIEGYRTGYSGGRNTFELAPIAVGDPLIAARYRLLGVANDDPLMPKDGPGLGIELRGRLPVGADSAFMGEGTTRLGARLLFDMQLLGAGIGGLVGYEGKVHPRPYSGEELRHALEAGAAVKVPLPSLHPLSAVGELRALIDFLPDESSSIEGQLGLRAALDEWTFTLAGGGAFIGVLGAPDARIILGVWYAPAVSDTDHDGVDDDEDQCPPLAEDPDGFEDGDGCPDPDNDNDIVPDIDDLCPNVEALEGQDDDEDGCTDKQG
jgi:hypothetical protein